MDDLYVVLRLDQDGFDKVSNILDFKHRFPLWVPFLCSFGICILLCQCIIAKNVHRKTMQLCSLFFLNPLISPFSFGVVEMAGNWL